MKLVKSLSLLAVMLGVCQVLATDSLRLDLNKYTAGEYTAEKTFKVNAPFDLVVVPEKGAEAGYWGWVSYSENLMPTTTKTTKSLSKKFADSSIISFNAETPGEAWVKIQHYRTDGRPLLGSEKTFHFNIK